MSGGFRTDAVDGALESLRKQLDAVRGTYRKRREKPAPVFWRFLRKVVLAVIAALLPFFVLLKISVSLYTEYDVSVWVSIAASAFLTTGLVALYTVLVAYWVTGRFRVSTNTLKASGVLVGIFCVYSLLYISAANVKSERIKETYGSLHPLLRLAVSTLVIVDSDLVVTDAGRFVEDYDRMGLPANQRSLHLRQSTGYVHAIDLRTLERKEFRNWLIAGYFRALGFATLRHVGTADHLHVSLPLTR